MRRSLRRICPEQYLGEFSHVLHNVYRVFQKWSNGKQDAFLENFLGDILYCSSAMLLRLEDTCGLEHHEDEYHMSRLRYRFDRMVEKIGEQYHSYCRWNLGIPHMHELLQEYREMVELLQEKSEGDGDQK